MTKTSEVQSLRAPLDTAQTLSDDWDRYDLGSIDWSNPPGNLPPDLANAIQFVEKNPALLKAITGGSGPVTKDELDKFIGSAQDDLDKAVGDYAAWQKANPDAGPMATALAQSAAFLEANNTLLGGQYNADDLANLGLQNPGLSPGLTGAAAMWSEPGMLFQLDTAGQTLGTTGDGLVNGANVSAWLAQGNAPGTDDAAMDLIDAAAARGPTSGIDTSSLNADIFAHPENYTGAQKAAALQQLMDTKTKLNLGETYQVTDTGTEEADGINPNLDKTNADLDSKISTLANDPDVQKFLRDNTRQSFNAIVNSDPDMKAAISASYQKFQAGATLNDDLALKDSTGTQISQTDAIHTFVSQAGFFQLATGQSIDLTAIAKKSGNYNQILDYYNSNIVTAKDMDAAWTAGGSGTSATRSFAAELQDYGAVIDPSDGAPQSGTLQDNMNTTMLSHLTPDELQAALGDGHGNLDQTKLGQILDAAADANGTPLTKEEKGQIIVVAQNFWNAVMFGTQTIDAAKSLGLTSWSNPVPNGAIKGYSIGAMHGASAVLGLVATGLSKPQAPFDAADIVQAAGFGILNVGQLLNSAGRIYNTATGSTSPSSTPGSDGASPLQTSPEEHELKDAQDAQKVATDNYNKAVGDTKDAKTKADDAFTAYDDAFFGEEKSAKEALEKAKSDKADPSTIAEVEKKYDDAVAKTADLLGKYDAANDKYQTAQANENKALSAKNQADQNVATAQNKLDAARAAPPATDHTYPPPAQPVDPQAPHGDSETPPLKNRGPATGETTTGVGGIIGGAATIVIGQHDKAADEVALGNLNIATGALTLASGVADTVEGGINAFGLGGKIVRGASLGDWAAFADGLVDTPLALGLFGVTLGAFLQGLKDEKNESVAETKSVDSTLKQYGITGGPTTPSDIQGTIPLAGGLQASPNSNAPGNAPPSGPSQIHPE